MESSNFSGGKNTNGIKEDNKTKIKLKKEEN